MGVKKFKTFEEARKDQWVFEPDDAYYRRIRKFYQFAFRLNPPQQAQGIFKFRNLSEAQKHER